MLGLAHSPSNRSIKFADLQASVSHWCGSKKSPFVGAVRKSGVDQGLVWARGHGGHRDIDAGHQEGILAVSQRSGTLVPSPPW